MTTFTASELKTNLDRNVNYLRTQPDSARVVTAAVNIVEHISTALVVKARNLPVSRATPLSISAPENRSKDFDEAVEQLIADAYSALEDMAEHERRVSSNVDLSDDDCVKLVLANLGKRGRNYAWAFDVAHDLELGVSQVLNALESLESDGCIEGPRSKVNEGAWNVRLNANGRNVAVGKPNKKFQGSPLVHQEFHPGSQNAVAGINYGSVNSTTIIFPTLPDDVRDALSDSERGAALIEAIDDARESKASPKILKGLVSAVKLFIETGNLSTEVATHAHECCMQRAKSLRTYICSAIESLAIAPGPGFSPVPLCPLRCGFVALIELLTMRSGLEELGVAIAGRIAEAGE